MKQLFIFITALVLLAGCAGMGVETSGASGDGMEARSFSDPSNIYFGD